MLTTWVLCFVIVGNIGNKYSYSYARSFINKRREEDMQFIFMACNLVNRMAWPFVLVNVECSDYVLPVVADGLW